MPGHKQVTVALDAMGGDHAPAAAIEGAEIACVRYPNVRYSLYGDTAQLAPLLAKHPKLAAISEIIHTDEIITQAMKPSLALRQGRPTSMRMAIEAVRDGKADCVVSGGNTGALMAIAKLVLRTIPGIGRPAICSLFPTSRGECVMLDLGANVECSAEDLYQFAIMGDAFARAVLGLPRPTIGLLNVGSEELKGHEDIKRAYQMLRENPLDLEFSGFVEGTGLTQGEVDVVVTDGFTGNIALKTAEGTARMIGRALKEAFTASPMAKLGALFAYMPLKAVKDRFNPGNHNGAMFVGLNGVVVKSHGSADAPSVANAIGVAVELVAGKINRHISTQLHAAMNTEPALAPTTAEG